MRPGINESKLRRMMREHDAREERSRQLMEQYRAATDAATSLANQVYRHMQQTSNDPRAFASCYGLPMSDLVALPADVQKAAAVPVPLVLESLEERDRARALIGHYRALQERVRTDGQLLACLREWAGYQIQISSGRA